MDRGTPSCAPASEPSDPGADEAPGEDQHPDPQHEQDEREHACGLGVLQREPHHPGDGAVLTEALDAPPEEWDGVLKARLLADDAVCTADEMIGVLQDKMGEVVLGMPAGSSVQSVIAEYLNELIGRAREVAAAEQ